MRWFLRRFWGPPAVYLAAGILARIGSFVLIPLYTRRLSLGEYGDYALGQTFSMLLQTLLTALFMTAFSRFYFDAADPKAAHRKAGDIAAWFVVVALSVAVALEAALLSVVFVIPDPQYSLPGPFGLWELSCLIVAGAGTAVGGVPFLGMRLAQRPLAASAFNLVQFLATAFSGVILVVNLGRGLRGAIEAMAISGIISCVISVLFIWRYYGLRLQREALRASVRFSLPLLPDSLIQFLRSAVDRWVLKSFGMTNDLGGYAVANQVLVPASLVSRSWNDAEGVRIGELYRAGGVKEIWAEMPSIVGGYLVTALGPVAAMVIATPLLSLVVGDRFGAALWMLPVLGLVMVLEALYSPPLYIVYYSSRNALISWITLWTFAFSVALNVGLISGFGLWGALVANLLTTISRVAAMWWFARRIAKDPPVR